MKAKSGRAVGSGLAVRIYLARCSSQCRTHDDGGSRPEMPCKVIAKGWPCFVVLVWSQVPCNAVAESWRASHGMRCASPNLMLPCMQSRAAPRNRAMLGAVLTSHTHTSFEGDNQCKRYWIIFSFVFACGAVAIRCHNGRCCAFC